MIIIIIIMINTIMIIPGPRARRLRTGCGTQDWLEELLPRRFRDFLASLPCTLYVYIYIHI